MEAVPDDVLTSAERYDRWKARVEQSRHYSPEWAEPLAPAWKDHPR